ncbi:hypothetical protein BJ741DRAFT_669684 [Chytriomyces cf. hyalinus JEL632]|nr:hypothetical protein BJ741DRAFT_669684 [Chytriomyces cf. hyalinus JEL632]
MRSSTRIAHTATKHTAHEQDDPDAEEELVSKPAKKAKKASKDTHDNLEDKPAKSATKAKRTSKKSPNDADQSDIAESSEKVKGADRTDQLKVANPSDQSDDAAQPKAPSKPAKGTSKRSKKKADPTDSSDDDDPPKRTDPLNDRLQSLSAQQLKDALRRNDQIVSGNKQVLQERIRECMSRGCLPKCPKCHGGRLRKSEKANRKGALECPGFVDDEGAFNRCGFWEGADKYQDLKVERPAWVVGDGDVV